MRALGGLSAARARAAGRAGLGLDRAACADRDGVAADEVVGRADARGRDDQAQTGLRRLCAHDERADSLGAARMNVIDLCERGLVPDLLTRAGMRSLVR